MPRRASETMSRQRGIFGREESMTTRKQIEANRENALRSTGPKTSKGKARVARNAVRHGLRSDLPVLPGERLEDWETHRAGVFGSLAPAGALEEALAERVALCLWRQRRVIAYETATTALAMDEITEAAHRQSQQVNHRFLKVAPDCGQADQLRLATAETQLAEAQETWEVSAAAYRLLEQLTGLVDSSRVNSGVVSMAFMDFTAAAGELKDEAVEIPCLTDHGLLTSLGVPEVALPDVYEWDGWTAGIVCRGLDWVANAVRIEPEKLLAHALKRREEARTESQTNVDILKKKVRYLRRRIRVRQDHLRQRRMLPDGEPLEKIMRYETHLARQTLQALHELQRLQATRSGQPAPLPAALDVTVESGTNAPTALGTIQEEARN
jgi:hypothetical protein